MSQPDTPKRDRVAFTRDAITFRIASDADYDFLRRLYHSTRAEEMQYFPFNDEQKVQFLDQQFRAQWEHYKTHYPHCERNIIEADGQPVGRIWIDDWSDQLRVVDIALLPEWRGSGLGTLLLREVLERGRAAKKPVSIHVEAFNPAMRLYERLGFQKVDSNGAYYLMRWTPEA